MSAETSWLLFCEAGVPEKFAGAEGLDIGPDGCGGQLLPTGLDIGPDGCGGQLLPTGLDIGPDGC
ncbi:MAG: hypothetical protein ABI234_12525, partial [Ktedonobacteraceae bacterium]